MKFFVESGAPLKVGIKETIKQQSSRVSVLQIIGQAKQYNCESIHSPGIASASSINGGAEGGEGGVG